MTKKKTSSSATTKTELTPPDLARCQAEVLEGSFMTFGPRSYQRCTNQPAVIVTEAKAGADGQRGSMSLCLPCRDVLIKKCGQDFFTEEPIIRKAAKQGGWTLTELLVGIGVITTAVIFLFTMSGYGCQPADTDIIRAVEAQGYSEAVVRDKTGWFIGARGCSGSDSFLYDMQATNALGKRVALVVCSGSTWNNKGVTVRTR